MSPSFILQEGALLLGDAHYSYLRPELLSLLKDIASKKIQTSQLILMGDVLDALFGNVIYTIKENRIIVRLIQKISKEIEVIYLEGNHDFQLANIFKDARVYPIQKQPIIAEYAEKTIALAHGDFDGVFSYRFYSKIMRNRWVLKLLNAIDTRLGNIIINKLDTYLEKKEDCKEFIGFREYLQKRHLEKYKCEYFIEGHYHQNKSYTFETFEYINLAAFACNQRYFIVKSLQERTLLEEKEFKGSS